MKGISLPNNRNVVNDIDESNNKSVAVKYIGNNFINKDNFYSIIYIE